MHIERMKKWASAVANFNGNFYLGSWGEFNSDGSLQCGCAGTVAALAFDGLEIVGFKQKSNIFVTIGHTIYHDGEFDYEAIAKFFDIEQRHAIEICSPSSYFSSTGTPKFMVVDRINDIIKQEEQERANTITPAFFNLDSMVAEWLAPERELEPA